MDRIARAITSATMAPKGSSGIGLLGPLHVEKSCSNHPVSLALSELVLTNI
jgi:hypothetical protein